MKLKMLLFVLFALLANVHLFAQTINGLYIQKDLKIPYDSKLSLVYFNMRNVYQRDGGCYRMTLFGEGEDKYSQKAIYVDTLNMNLWYAYNSKTGRSGIFSREVNDWLVKPLTDIRCQVEGIDSARWSNPGETSYRWDSEKGYGNLISNLYDIIAFKQKNVFVFNQRKFLGNGDAFKNMVGNLIENDKVTVTLPYAINPLLTDNLWKIIQNKDYLVIQDFTQSQKSNLMFLETNNTNKVYQPFWVEFRVEKDKNKKKARMETIEQSDNMG